jgi:uncharacterized protein (DUF1697 family)
MVTYIAILRGINVGGSKMIKMDNLKLSLGELNFKNIETYIQSGNLLFKYTKKNQQDLADLITHKIREAFGLQVPVIVKSTEELNMVMGNNPFITSHNVDIDKLHVTFFSEEPEKALQDKLREIESHPDEFILSGNVAYLFCPNGYGRTKLTNTFFEHKLHISATTRNWKTVIKLTEMGNAK